MDDRYVDLMSSEEMKKNDAGEAGLKKAHNLAACPSARVDDSRVLDRTSEGRLYAVLGATDTSQRVLIAT